MKRRMTQLKKLLVVPLSVVMILATVNLVPAAETTDMTGATTFTFTDDGISAAEGDYSGYTIEGTDLTIKSAGTYVLTGSCADGTVVVKKGTTGVTLVLDGLTLTSEDTAPISCNKSTGVTIVAASGSTNTLTDTEYNNDEAYTDNTEAENAVIKCKDGSQVTICGDGTLNIVSNGKNGIKSGETTDEEGTAWLTIDDLTLNITANVNDAINAESTLNVVGGDITISAEDDAIHSDYTLNIGADNTSGPTIQIEESTEGLEGATVNIYSGDITVHATDDGINAANSDLSNYDFAISVSGGDVYIDTSAGDGIDSNGSITISGGEVQVFSQSSGDNQPIDADGEITLSGGTVLAVGASGMGTQISSASQIYVTFGGMGGQMQGGMNGQMQSSTTDQMQGGMSGQMQGGMSGQMQGGMSGQMQGGMGGQNGGTASISAGDLIEIKDSSDQTLYSATAVRAAEYVLFSSPELSSDETYSLYLNGTAANDASSGTTEGGFPEGNPPGGNIPGTGNQGMTQGSFGQWIQSGTKWWYRHMDGSYTTSGWEYINGKWYLFDASGWMLTGWQYVNGSWYYLNSSGAMTTGWQSINGKWYYMNSSGAMTTGWQKINGSWYYMNGNGAMLTGWLKIGTTWYYLNSSGAMATGWQKINNTWYYFESSGAMAANQWVGNYYLTSTGAMAVSQWIGSYYVGADGKWIP